MNRCEGRILSNEAVVRTTQNPGQQPVHFQEIVMPCQGIAPRLPGHYSAVSKNASYLLTPSTYR